MSGVLQFRTKKKNFSVHAQAATVEIKNKKMKERASCVIMMTISELRSPTTLTFINLLFLLVFLLAEVDAVALGKVYRVHSWVDAAD